MDCCNLKSGTIEQLKAILLFLGLGLFFFDFIEIHVLERNFGLSGFDMVFGAIETDAIGKVYVFQPDFWSACTVFLLIVGMIVWLLQFKSANPILFLIALIGVMNLIFLQIKLQFYLEAVGRAEVGFTVFYWMLLSIFCALGCISFVEMPKQETKTISSEKQSGITINIITQPNNKYEADNKQTETKNK